jgi:hypothetical protein
MRKGIPTKKTVNEYSVISKLMELNTHRQNTVDATPKSQCFGLAF